MSKIEELNEIIQITKAVIERKIDPFKIDVRALLKKIDEIFPMLRDLEAHLMDAEAIHGISSVVKEQTDDLNYRSSMLYISPEKVMEKIEKMDITALANLISLSLHPISSTEFINEETMVKAYEYWNSIQRSEKKIRQLPEILKFKSEELKIVKRELMKKLEEFDEYLNKITPLKLSELIANMEERDKIDKIYLLSYLITEGKYSLKEIEDDFIIIKGQGKKMGSLIFNFKI